MRNELELKDLRAPMTPTTGLLVALAIALIFTMIPVLSEGIGDPWKRGKELATAFGALALVMLMLGVLRTSDYYVFDEGPSLRIRKVDGLPQNWHPASTPLYLRLSSFGCWARVLGSRTQFWPKIKVFFSREGEMRLQLRDVGGMRCDAAHPSVAIECIQRFNNVPELVQAATQGVQEREELKRRFRKMVCELVMLEQLTSASQILDSPSAELIQRHVKELRKLLPPGLHGEAPKSTSDVRKAIISSAKNRVAQVPQPEEDKETKT